MTGPAPDADSPAVFDAHAHVLSTDPSRYPTLEAARAYTGELNTVEQLLAGMDANNVAAAALVQRYYYYGTDNSYVLDACTLAPDRLVPVVILDSQDVNTPQTLRRLAGEQRVGGIRFGPVVNTLDTSWLNSPPAMAVWECAAELGLPVVVITWESHIGYNHPAIRMIADMFPQLPILLDHLGTRNGAGAEGRAKRAMPDCPPFLAEPDFGVTPALRDLAQAPNVSFKFTGINLEMLSLDHVDAATFLRMFVDLVGADRVLVGSDIGQTKGPYGRIVSELRAATGLLSGEERAQVLYQNGARIYGLQ